MHADQRRATLCSKRGTKQHSGRIREGLRRELNHVPTEFRKSSKYRETSRLLQRLLEADDAAGDGGFEWHDSPRDPVRRDRRRGRSYQFVAINTR